MIISLIVAMDKNGGIGRNEQLPWHISSDLKRFKALTMGHYILMGRKTYETIGKSLPGRKMIVLTHRKGYHPEGCSIVHSMDSAIKLARDNQETELFIIGGGQVFSQSINLADKIYLTRVQAEVDANVFFPNMNESGWKVWHAEEAVANEKDEYGSIFMILVRNKGQQG